MGTQSLSSLGMAPGRLGLGVASFLLAMISACGPQTPSFSQETQQSKVDPTTLGTAGSGDATAAGAGAGGAGGATGATDGSGAGGAGSVGGAGGSADGTGSAGAGGTGSGGAAFGTEGGIVIPAGGSTAGGSTAGGTGSGSTAGSTASGTGSGSTAGGTGSGSTAGGTGSGSTAGGTGSGGTAGGSEPFLNINTRTVELTEPRAGKVDILWVVDSSASMASVQQALATNFNAMITQLDNAGHDFQTAVTTTDVCQDTVPSDLSQRVCPVDYGGSPATHLRGSFVGDVGRKVLKYGDADLISRFNTYTTIGTSGSGFEHGLYGAQLAVAKSLAGQNEPLIRSDAFLAVIVVSDEEDDGIGLGMVDAYNHHNFVADGLTTFRYTDDDMISYLQGVKGAGKFSISGIVSTRNANGTLCSSPIEQPLEEGTQYEKAAQKSGGVIQSICEQNWSASLTQLGLDLNAQITQVTLPSKPDTATIRVTVNGVATTAWTYNAANNAVKFNAGQVPAEGAAIKIVYIEI